MLNRLVIFFVAMLCIIFVFLGLVLQLFSEGSMPSKNTALAIRDEVVTWGRKSASTTEQIDLPSATDRLAPLDVELVGGGVLLIFHKRFVEERGYFYVVNANDPPEELQWFCKYIGDGVYLYYNPG